MALNDINAGWFKATSDAWAGVAAFAPGQAPTELYLKDPDLARWLALALGSGRPFQESISVVAATWTYPNIVTAANPESNFSLNTFVGIYDGLGPTFSGVRAGVVQAVNYAPSYGYGPAFYVLFSDAGSVLGGTGFLPRYGSLFAAGVSPGETVSVSLNLQTNKNGSRRADCYFQNVTQGTGFAYSLKFPYLIGQSAVWGVGTAGSLLWDTLPIFGSIFFDEAVYRRASDDSSIVQYAGLTPAASGAGGPKQEGAVSVLTSMSREGSGISASTPILNTSAPWTDNNGYMPFMIQFDYSPIVAGGGPRTSVAYPL